MKVNIDLSNDTCEDILGMNGYVSEEVTAYFSCSLDPYDKGENSDDLKPIKVKIAYHRMERPKELDKEYPMLDVLDKYKYDKVIEELFNSRLRDIFFNF